MKREVRIAVGGRDVCGFRIEAKQAIFLNFDKNLNLHDTAHDPDPEKGYEKGAVHTKVEPLPSGEAAGAIWLEQQSDFEQPLAGIKNPVLVHSGIFLTDDEALVAYPASKEDGIPRLAISSATAGEYVSAIALLTPAAHWWVLGQHAASSTLFIVDTSATPWMFLGVDPSAIVGSSS